MEIKHRISSSQFFVMMFLSRVAVSMGLNAQALKGENMLEAIISYALAMTVGVLFALPIWALQKRRNVPIPQAAGSSSVFAEKAVAVIYIVYFVLSCGSTLGLFQIFLLDVVNPDFSSALTMAVLLAVAMYGAFKGIETVGRCGVCVFAIFAVGVSLVFGISACRFDVDNLTPPFTDGYRQTVNGIALFLSRTTVFANMAVLLPLVNEAKKRSFFGWLGGAVLFMSVLLLLLAGCLGPYAATQNFPVFVLSSISEVRSLQRLDAVFTGIWMMGLIVKLSCELYACRVCFTSILGKSAAKTSVIASGALVLIISYGTVSFPAVQRALLDPFILLCFTAAVSFVIPLLVLPFVKKKE